MESKLGRKGLLLWPKVYRQLIFVICSLNGLSSMSMAVSQEQNRIRKAPTQLRGLQVMVLHPSCIPSYMPNNDDGCLMEIDDSNLHEISNNEYFIISDIKGVTRTNPGKLFSDKKI